MPVKPVTFKTLINANKDRRPSDYSGLVRKISPHSPKSVYYEELGEDTSATQQIIDRLSNKVSYTYYQQAIDQSQVHDRKARYVDFEMMEFEPMISSALDIYADEATIFNEEGKVLSIYSDDKKNKEYLEDFFYNVLDIENNAWGWMRNLCKYGDIFMYTETEEKNGIVRVLPLPSIEIAKEMGFDEDSPEKIRYQWSRLESASGQFYTSAIQDKPYIEEINMAHFALGGDDRFKPYSRGILDSARRIFKQITMLEDAMMVYRITRAPERRVFNIEVGNMNPKDVGDYLESVKRKLKKTTTVEKDTGLTHLRYNPMAVDEDYILPSRGGVSSQIDTLPGAQNMSDIDDIEYIQKKLFSVLKVPKSYLTYEEDISAKSLLSQEDVRFSRTIQRIQKAFLASLTRLATIHLYLKGVHTSDVLNFKLTMTNPSHQAELMQAALWTERINLFKEATGKDQAFSVEYAMQHFLRLSNEEIIRELKRIKTNPHDELASDEGGEMWDEEGDEEDRSGYDSGEMGVEKPDTDSPMAFESENKRLLGTVYRDLTEQFKIKGEVHD